MGDHFSSVHGSIGLLVVIVTLNQLVIALTLFKIPKRMTTLVGVNTHRLNAILVLLLGVINMGLGLNKISARREIIIGYSVLVPVVGIGFIIREILFQVQRRKANKISTAENAATNIPVQ